MKKWDVIRKLIKREDIKEKMEGEGRLDETRKPYKIKTKFWK